MEELGIGCIAYLSATIRFSGRNRQEKQFKIVSGLLKKADTIIIATDSDREGENIAWSIIHESGAFSNKKCTSAYGSTVLKKM